MSNAKNKVEEIKNTIRNRVAQGANLSALIDLAHLRAEATNGGDAKLVRACLLDVFQEVNGEQAVDALLEKLGM